MTTTTKVKAVKVALKMSKMTFLQLADFASHVVSSMTANAHFTAPLPTMATMNANIASLTAAIAAAKPTTPAATADKHAKKKVLYDAMNQLGAYVAGVANLDPPNAATIIASAGMVEKAAAKPKASGFRLVLSTTPGDVTLYTTSVKNAAYKWQYTLTPAVDASWITVEGTLAKYLITGLTSASRYYFRVAVITHITGPWSNQITTVML
jgi:hypothetical protein